MRERERGWGDDADCEESGCTSGDGGFSIWWWMAGDGLDAGGGDAQRVL